MKIWIYFWKYTAEKKVEAAQVVFAWSRYFLTFSYIWPSDDLEHDVMEVNWPSHRNQRPQKPLYIQSVSAVPE